VAEEAPVFGRVIFRQGGNSVLTVAFDAEFFRLFFIHGHEPFMIGVVRQPRRGLRRGIPQKQEQTDAEKKKKGIIHHYFYSTIHQ